ncbi:DegT/DnrJ/EryC1/StrS family aminotransferase [Litchfieldella xinjiangensis]|uniref:DegT/DnrJ/EryC1/StrS family aminotransferase n=1 Tax=Litchfieldella xinjiangensis TaxID=1166948 RepID=UPI000A615334|nr:DegT/DnrJ/EryC1/StrS aminotransferase family protein [Halomonas xinjiangensis]
MLRWPQYSEDEQLAVANILRSGKVNYWSGQEGQSFEQEFAAYHQANFGIALANGTVALELALIALGIGAGDEVVVSPRTFIASASSIALQGATPVFADVDEASGNITVDSVQAVLSERTRAIIAVHHSGWPCNMDRLGRLARYHRLALIEDCAQAHGATWNGQPVGSFGDAAAFSFCTDKIMSTGGEGGMLLLQDEDAWKRAWSYKDHGKDWDAVMHRSHPPGFRWLHESFGTNWRLTEMQSAIGRLQLRKLSTWLAQRRENARALAAGLSNVPALRIPVPPAEAGHAYYRFYAYIRPDELRRGWSRDRVVAELQRGGVSCMHGGCSEVYLERAFEATPFAPRVRFPVARRLGETSLMFMVDPTYSVSDMRHQARVVSRVMAQASSPVHRTE